MSLRKEDRNLLFDQMHNLSKFSKICESPLLAHQIDYTIVFPTLKLNSYQLLHLHLRAQTIPLAPTQLSPHTLNSLLNPRTSLVQHLHQLRPQFLLYLPSLLTPHELRRPIIYQSQPQSNPPPLSTTKKPQFQKKSLKKA